MLRGSHKNNVTNNLHKRIEFAEYHLPTSSVACCITYPLYYTNLQIRRMYIVKHIVDYTEKQKFLKANNL